MGYFDGLVSGSFKTDSAGRTLFYPFGMLGKGRVAPSDAEAQALRASLKRYYIVVLPLVIALSVWNWQIGIPVALLGAVGFSVWVVRRTSAWQGSDERLSYAESSRNTGRSLGRTWIFILLTIALLFIVAGLIVLTQPGGIGIGLMALAFGGVLAAAFGFMLKAAR